MFGWFKSRAGMPGPNPNSYQPFTTIFDREVSARTLLNERRDSPLLLAQREAMLAALRAPTVEQQRARDAVLAFQARWSRGHELGARPLVTLLFDHSGSMRGLKSRAAALTADIVGDGLTSCDVDFEVLGYTTRSWHGGESRRLGKRSGRPQWPGRLCDLQHIVYRDAASAPVPWQRDLVLMLYDDALKENVDGEALEWARKRAEAFGYSAWICIVLSDGAPVDDSTMLANGPDGVTSYLVDHLKSVIEVFEASERVRLGAVGIGYEVNQYYRVSRTPSALSDLPFATIQLLEDLIWPPVAA